MLKQLFVTAAAAAAVSVPLAGAAWADKPEPANNPPGQDASGHGIPHAVGATLDAITMAGREPPGPADPNAPNLNPNGSGPVTPGRAFNRAKDWYEEQTGQKANTPTAVGAFVDMEFNDYLGIPGTQFGKEGLPPGLATKSFTPGCASGHIAASGPVGQPPVCN